MIDGTLAEWGERNMRLDVKTCNNRRWISKILWWFMFMLIITSVLEIKTIDEIENLSMFKSLTHNCKFNLWLDGLENENWLFAWNTKRENYEIWSKTFSNYQRDEIFENKFPPECGRWNYSMSLLLLFCCVETNRMCVEFAFRWQKKCSHSFTFFCKIRSIK